MTAPISLELMAPLTGSQFLVHTSAGMQELQLFGVEELARKGLPAEFRTPLSLLLEGPNTIRLSQDNYVLDHPRLGRLEWLIVPIITPASARPEPGQPPRHFYQVLFS